MATDSNTGSTTPSTTPTGEGETPPEGQQQQTPAPEAGEQETPPAATVDKNTKLPDDHPLVTTLATLKDRVSTLTTELAEARAQASRATSLEEDLGKRPTPEALQTLQTRYDRLEAFTQAVGLGKALDSRTFTKDLFETDKDIATLVKDWNKAHPSATSDALGSAAAAPATGKIDPNTLLRIAAGKQ